MKIERLIAPRSTDANFHVTGEPTVSFISRLHCNPVLGIPRHYAIAQRSNGAVDRFEYSSPEEYRQHYSKVMTAITAEHERSGVRLGCQCAYCRKQTGMDAQHGIPKYLD